jgi:tRNA(His) guanylyltransferase
MLVKSGKSATEAQNILKGTQTQEKNELLFQQFGINYNTLPAVFRKGSCIFKEEVEEVVKCTEAGDPIKRRRRKIVVQHCDIIGKNLWDEHPYLLSDK